MGKVITTHLVDGNPRGIRNVFISNKICNMYVIPRQQINEANANDDIQLEQPAFYILLGDNEDFSSLPKAYIGQTENFKERVKSHESKKDFWHTALVFIAKDNSLTKVDVQYIEAKAIKKAKAIKSYLLSENKNQPAPPSLPPHLRDTVSEFIEDIELLTAFMGCTIFIDKGSVSQTKGDALFYFKAKGGEANATATYDNGTMTVLAGSILAHTSVPSLRGGQARDVLVLNLTEEKCGQRVLKVNKEFSSPSTAASFVSGSSVNGWNRWKDKHGKSLGEVFKH